jgi:hypothetical protein
VVPKSVVLRRPTSHVLFVGSRRHLTHLLICAPSRGRGWHHHTFGTPPSGCAGGRPLARAVRLAALLRFRRSGVPLTSICAGQGGTLLARRDHFILHLSAEGITVRAIPSALWRVHDPCKRRSRRHNGPADQGTTYGLPVRRWHPYPSSAMTTSPSSSLTVFDSRGSATTTSPSSSSIVFDSRGSATTTSTSPSSTCVALTAYEAPLLVPLRTLDKRGYCRYFYRQPT